MTQRKTRGNSPYEKKQSQAVASAGKKAMEPRRGAAPSMLKSNARLAMDDGERKMSISASKNREDPGGSKFSKGGMVKRK